MKKLAIIGSGDLAQQIMHHALISNFETVGYFNDFLVKGYEGKGKKILGKTEDIIALFEQGVFDEIIIGIGYKHFEIRALLFEKYHKIIHPTCFVDRTVKIGDGVVLFPNSTFDENVIIEANVLINVGCIISHDTRIRKNTFLSPSVSLAGFIDIGEQNNIGIGTVIIDYIKTSDNVQTGGGTEVINDIEKPGLYVGNPQRFIR
tara:strand:+ start:31544 stop:32155 length:612 start_codon:yes stop_codon:yes gene_type:complete